MTDSDVACLPVLFRCFVYECTSATIAETCTMQRLSRCAALCKQSGWLYTSVLAYARRAAKASFSAVLHPVLLTDRCNVS